MKKIILILFVFAAVLSCKKNEYESYRILPDIEKITRVNLSPNSPALIGNGKAELLFKVKAYMNVSHTRTIEVTENDKIILKDSTFTSEIEITEDRIPKEWIKIYLEDGTPVENVFKTTKNIGETLKFKASVNGVESKVREVKIVAEPVIEPEQIIVPVIFHIVYYKKEEYQYTDMNNAMLTKLIERLNKAFAGELYPNAATSANTNIKFELATLDKSGKPLKEVGINRVMISDSDNSRTYCKNNLVWDLTKYLNIWVHSGRDEWGIGVSAPRYILNNGSELIMGENSWEQLMKVEKVTDAKWNQISEVGIEFNKVHLYRMVNATNSSSSGGTGDRLENVIGQFYGLKPTYRFNYNENNLTDYCDDTYTHLSIYSRPEKWNYTIGTSPGNDKQFKDGNEIYYDSYNIMDNHSMSSTITPDQAKRIRIAIKNCPFRMMKK